MSLLSPLKGGKERQIPGTHWPAGPHYLVKFQANLRPLSHKKKRKVPKEWHQRCPLTTYMCIHMHVHIHVSTSKYTEKIKTLLFMSASRLSCPTGDNNPPSSGLVLLISASVSSSFCFCCTYCCCLPDLCPSHLVCICRFSYTSAGELPPHCP